MNCSIGGVQTASTNSNREEAKMTLILTAILLLLTMQVEAREIFLTRTGNWEEFYQNKELAREFNENKNKKLVPSIFGLRGYTQIQLGELILSGLFYINNDLWIVYLQSVIRFHPDGQIAFYWTSESEMMHAGGKGVKAIT